MQKAFPDTKLAPLTATILIGLVVWFIPPPEGVGIQAWHLLAIFSATIVGIVIKPLPMGAVAMLGIIATALTGTLTITEALSGFGNRVIWLLVTAFFISRGFIKTGLGARIAYHIIRFLGKSSLGLAYGLAASDLVLSPAIPSNTARAGGVIFPLVRSIALAYSSEPETGTARRTKVIPSIAKEIQPHRNRLHIKDPKSDPKTKLQRDAIANICSESAEPFSKRGSERKIRSRDVLSIITTLASISLLNWQLSRR